MNAICILGLGYIGLPTAAMFASHGYQVYGVDVNNEIINTLNNGGIHIEEPGLKEVVHAAISSGNLCVSCTPHVADAFIIAVPTPFKHNEFGEYEGKRYKLADMRAVTSAAEAIVPHLRKGNLVILESTSPVRTTVDLVQPILEKSGLKAGEDFSLAYSPERVLPGQILKELVENARVIGGIDPASAQKGRDLYSAFVKGEIILTSASTAEMVKLMENTYRDINIAIANEFSRLSDRFGVDIWEAIEIANLHPRVKILKPGPGVGGHCISVDPWFFVEAAPDISNLIYSSRITNDSQPEFVVEMLKRASGGDVSDKKIAVLGLSFKPNVDDIRESPAVTIAQRLSSLGARVCAFEPYRPWVELPGIEVVSSLRAAVKEADLILVLVAHSVFKEILPEEILANSSARDIIDAVNLWDPAKWQEAGFRVSTLGKNSATSDYPSLASV